MDENTHRSKMKVLNPKKRKTPREDSSPSVAHALFSLTPSQYACTDIGQHKHLRILASGSMCRGRGRTSPRRCDKLPLVFQVGQRHRQLASQVPGTRSSFPRPASHGLLASALALYLESV